MRIINGVPVPEFTQEQAMGLARNCGLFMSKAQITGMEAAPFMEADAFLKAIAMGHYKVVPADLPRAVETEQQAA